MMERGTGCSCPSSSARFGEGASRTWQLPKDRKAQRTALRAHKGYLHTELGGLLMDCPKRQIGNADGKAGDMHIAPWSSPAMQRTPPCWLDPAMLACFIASVLRSTPGPLPYLRRVYFVARRVRGRGNHCGQDRDETGLVLHPSCGVKACIKSSRWWRV